MKFLRKEFLRSFIPVASKLSVTELFLKQDVVDVLSHCRPHDIINGLMHTLQCPIDPASSLEDRCIRIELLLLHFSCSTLFDDKHFSQIVGCCFRVLSLWIRTHLGRHRLWVTSVLMCTLQSARDLRDGWQTNGSMR